MTKTELNAFRKALENKQAEVGDGSGNREALAINTSPEELDRIQNASDRDWAMGNLERNNSRLREVQAALRRVGDGTFGVCAACDEDISPKRLAAVPWASLCIVCQETADREGKAPWETDTSLELAA
jgi:DnaK suppressor protein